ncbi:prophage protein [Lactiplantibacillus pentosus KCA1]|nr:prophage protein [Lactiplantibacillus pentosus KCA1]
MAKTLEFTINSPWQIKQGDTETTFTFICKNAGSAVNLNQATSITAKIGNASGYLRSQPIAITSLTGLKPGWLNLQPTSTLMAGLPAGDYQLEIWVVDQAGTSIYPSDGSTGFAITNNIQSANGSTITTITFDDFVAAMNKAASTIAKGDKGDTGPIGPKGADAVINVVTQAQYDALTDKSGVYFIEG